MLKYEIQLATTTYYAKEGGLEEKINELLLLDGTPDVEIKIHKMTDKNRESHNNLRKAMGFQPC